MRFTCHVFWILGLSLSLNVAATGGYRASYAQGLEAVKKEQWVEAADLFRQAIREEPEAGMVSFDGKRHLYLPHFQLGVALYNAGALKEAEKALRKSAELLGRLRKRLDFHKETKKYRSDIDMYISKIDEAIVKIRTESQTPPPPPPTAPTDEELAIRRKAAKRQIERAERQIRRLGEPRLLAALDANPSLWENRRKGVEKLEQARELHGKAVASGDPAALQEVCDLAVDAVEVLDRVVLDATRWAEEPSRKP